MSTPRRRRRGRSGRGGLRTALALAVPALLLSINAPASAIETQRFGVEPYPLFEGNEPRRAFELSLAPGERVEDSVRVWNKSRTPLVVRLYGAAVDLQGGEYVVAASEEAGQGAAAWVSPRAQTLRLAPGEEAVVPFAVQAPPVMSEGERLAALVAESDAGSAAEGVDVLARLALVLRLTRGGSLLGAVSWLAALAAALVVLVAAGHVVRRWWSWRAAVGAAAAAGR